jgi:hypothetical protein
MRSGFTWQAALKIYLSQSKTALKHNGSKNKRRLLAYAHAKNIQRLAPHCFEQNCLIFENGTNGRRRLIARRPKGVPRLV